MVSSGEKCSSLGASLKPEAHEKARRAWRMPDALWQHRGPLLPPRPPFGGQRPYVDARKAREALFFVRRTGGPGNARHEPGIASRRAA